MIEAVHLRKRFGDVEIIKDATFRAERRTSFIGRNGSGKTTLLKILAFILRPDGGNVFYGGLPWDRARVELRGKVILAHQEPVVLRGTVLYNLLMCRDAEEALEMFRLKPLAHEKAHRLSTGLKKLITVARVFACKPMVALLDEPTSYLDDEKRELVIEAMRGYGGYVIFTSHYYPDIKEADPQAVYEINDGMVRRLV